MARVMGTLFEDMARVAGTLHEDMAPVIGTLHEDQYTLLIISLSMFQINKSCREKQTRILCSVFFFSKIVPFMKRHVKNFYRWAGHR
jgi:hypothetical protein